ncbi:iron-containing alcohol dehydrogenase [Chelativorans sp. AA-79]|uniref:iron-containing alcohol dehydrogenase n=1 Tax=Chelativorans sp. AA-79 TaxID=3028735 RepID=UPI0023F692AE|nr:iron-containing alcohol dehydrogenase [Chelativorans sp. AA-79]WEX11277.1 iron-containing alcohol dehydrogenase [Chelativorans sp. AA-79]
MSSADTASTTAASGAFSSPLLRPLSFVQPPRIEFGSGKARLLAELIPDWPERRVLVVADAFNAGRADLLGLPRQNLVFPEAKPEPDLPNLARLLDQARGFAPDLVIGFGGGSAMDLAKLAAVLVGSAKEFHAIAGVDKADPRTVGLIAIPTTSGTGSEVGARALVTDPASRSKVAAESRHMVADMAIVDPDLTVSLPPAVTAATGIDALAHCVEAFTSRRAHPLLDIYAQKGIELVGQYLARAVADGADVEARAGLAMAALYGGFCLGPVNTTAGHALSYPLGTRYGIAHGLANAVIFPHALAFNAPAQPEKTAIIAELMGFDGNRLFDSAYRYCAELGIEMHMSKLGVPPDDLPSMAAEALGIRRLLDFNPRDMTGSDILEIYRAAW